MKKLGEILVEKELITNEQLNRGLKKQAETGDKLGKLLIKMDIVSEEQLFTFLSKQYGVVMFNKQELTIPAEVQKLVKYDLVYNYGIIPFKVTDKGVHIGFSDFRVLNDIDEISFKIGKNVIPVLFPDSMYEKILSDIKEINYGEEDYYFQSFKKKVEAEFNKGAGFEAFLSAIISFEPNLTKVFFAEGSAPAIRKIGKFYKLNTDPMKKEDILSYIKSLTDEATRKTLLHKKTVRFYKTVAGKNFFINIVRQKSSYLIVLTITSSEIPKFNNLGFKGDVSRYILNPAKGFYFFIAPLGHGKATTMASIVNHFNKSKTQNILFLEKQSMFEIASDKSIVTQLDLGMRTYNKENFFKIIYDLDPEIIFLMDIDNLEILDMALKFVESGRTVYACYEAGSISGALEKLFLLDNSENKYYVNKFASLLRLVVNFRLVPVETIERKSMVYEYMYNSFKLRKALMEGNFKYIDSQLRGTADYMPFEKSLAELYMKKLIDMDTAENYSLDFELFKNYAGIKES